VLKNPRDSTRDLYLTSQGTWLLHINADGAQVFDTYNEANAKLIELALGNDFDPEYRGRLTVCGHQWCRFPDGGAGRI